MKDIFTHEIFSENAFLLQKFENKIFSLKFSMKGMPSVFDEVKVAVN